MSKFAKFIAIFVAVFAAGMTWAASTTSQTEDSVAAVGTQDSKGVFQPKAYYTDLQEAVNAISSSGNYRVRLLKDLALTKGLTFTDKSANGVPAISGRTESFIIDLGEKTLSMTDVDGYVLTVDGTCVTTTMRLMNGTIAAAGTTKGALNVKSRAVVRVHDVTMTSANASNPTCLFGATIRNGVLINSVVTNTAGGVGVSVLGQQGFFFGSTISSVGGTAVYVKLTSAYTGYNRIAGGFVSTKTDVTGVTAFEVDENCASPQIDYVSITSGKITGELKDDGYILTVCGGTYTMDPDGFYLDGYDQIDNGDGTYTVVDASKVIIDDGNGEKNVTIAEAFNVKGVAKRVIKLNGDIFLLALESGKNAIEVGNGQDITVDLNGHSLNVFDVSATYSDINCANVSGTGKLTLTDTSTPENEGDPRTGYLAFTPWLMDWRSSPGFASNMLKARNTSTLNIIDGTYDHLGYYRNGYSVASYTIDVYETANVNISGGTFFNSNTVMRMFYSGQKVDISGGTLDGGLTAIWLQGTTAADLKISGGSFFGLGSYGVIYNTGNSAASNSKVLIRGGEYQGCVTCYGGTYMQPAWFTIEDASFVDPAGNNFHLYGPNGRLVLKGGVYDRCYLQYWNYMKEYDAINWNLYLTVDGSIRVENDNRYHFGDQVAVTCDEYGWPVDYFSSLSMAIANAGVSYPVYSGANLTAGYSIELCLDDADSIAQTVSTTLDPVVYLKGHSVTSEETQPLITAAKGTIKIADAGSISSVGPVFKTTSGEVDIYDGDYSTKGNELFSGTVKIMADVGDGSYFDVNPASFSHDVSSFVYNKSGAIEFKTIQAPIDSRYYLGRNVEVVKEQN